MADNYLIKTSRLGLRTWKRCDLKPFAKINGDPMVMRCYPNVLTREQSDNFVKRIIKQYQDYGFSVYAVDHLANQQFIGYIGFMRPKFESDFTPCIEIGWRLDANYWNKGLATEGALACLDYGFKVLDFKEIYSFTATTNKPSERVMQKIGLKKIGTFEHPLLEKESPLRTHLLYKTEK